MSPRDIVTYELRAVNGAVVPASFRVASGDTLRIISERLVFGPDDVARSVQRRKYGWDTVKTVAVSYLIRAEGDSVRFDFLCPFNALCDIADRIGRREFGSTLQLREVSTLGFTFDYVRVE